MAEFKFSCPQCGQRIQCDTSYSGRQINCPACQQTVVVPRADGATPVQVKPQALRKVLVIAAAVVVLAGLVFVGRYGYLKIRMHSGFGHLPSGVVALWSGDGNAKNSVDGKNGRLLNGASFAPGKIGKAFVFHNLGDQVVAPATGLPTGTSDRTIACWIYINSLAPGGEAFLVGYGKRGTGQTYQLEIVHGQRLVFTQWGGSFDGPVLDTDRWYHVAVTSVGTRSIKLYVDGVNVTTGALDFNTPAGGQFWIGKIQSSNPVVSPCQFDGLIDEVAVFNRALSASEIQAIYEKQK